MASEQQFVLAPAARLTSANECKSDHKTTDVYLCESLVALGQNCFTSIQLLILQFHGSCSWDCHVLATSWKILSFPEKSYVGSMGSRKKDCTALIVTPTSKISTISLSRKKRLQYRSLQDCDRTGSWDQDWQDKALDREHCRCICTVPRQVCTAETHQSRIIETIHYSNVFNDEREDNAN